jgi:hypothetical protein
VREFCAGHACSPESSGRRLQGGGGHTFEGSLSSSLSSGSLGSVLLPPAAVPVFCWEARNVPFRGAHMIGNQRSREVSMRVSSPSVPFMR